MTNPMNTNHKLKVKPLPREADQQPFGITLKHWAQDPALFVPAMEYCENMNSWLT